MYCSGKGQVQIFDKHQKKLKQTFASENLYTQLNEKTTAPIENMLKLYDGQSAVLFDDFNFDGQEDIAVRNGNNSAYGGPSYDVYLYHSKKATFILSQAFTALANENLGMFQTDPKRKRLVTYTKSGCCWHLKTEYGISPHNKGLVKLYELEEDATKGSGKYVLVTIRKLVQNQWRSSTRKYNTEDYYK